MPYVIYPLSQCQALSSFHFSAFSVSGSIQGVKPSCRTDDRLPCPRHQKWHCYIIAYEHLNFNRYQQIALQSTNLHCPIRVLYPDFPYSKPTLDIFRTSTFSCQTNLWKTKSYYFAYLLQIIEGKHLLIYLLINYITSQLPAYTLHTFFYVVCLIDI